MEVSIGWDGIVVLATLVIWMVLIAAALGGLDEPLNRNWSTGPITMMHAARGLAPFNEPLRMDVLDTQKPAISTIAGRSFSGSALGHLRLVVDLTPSQLAVRCVLNQDSKQ